MTCWLIEKKESVRNEHRMEGRRRTQANFAIIAGIYPDFYGWRHYYFVSFLGVTYPTLYPFFVITYIYSFFISLHYENVELFSQILCVGTLTMIYFMVSFFHITKKRAVDEIMEMIGRGFSNYSRPQTKREKELESEMDNETKKYAVASTIMLISISIVHMGVLPILKAARGQYTSVTNTTAPINMNTPLPIYWILWETDNFGGFVAALFCQMIPGCMEISIVNACVILFVGFSQQLSGNFTILNESLRDIHARALYMLQGAPNADEIVRLDAYDLYKNKRFLDCLNECFKENVMHHNSMIRFYHKVQSIVGFSILAVVTGNAVIISTSMYSTLLAFEKGGETEIFIINIVLWTFHIVVNTFLLAVYCFYGQKVTDNSGTFLEALYDTPWIEADTRFRKSVFIAMSYAQETIKLESSGGIVVSSYETLLNVVQTSFSYLNMFLAAR